MRTFALGFLLPTVLFAAVDARTADVTALALATAALLGFRRGRQTATLLLLGLTLYGLRGRAKTEPPLATPGPVVVEGVVAGDVRAVGERYRVPLESRPHLLFLQRPPDLLPGTRIRAEGSLDPDGAFVTIRSPTALRADAPPGWHPRTLVARARRVVRRRLTRAVSPVTAAYLRALLLGDRSLARDDRDRLARTGTLHLFAVSGLHLAVLIAMLRVPFASRPLPILIVATAYATLTGLRSPVGRALVLGIGSLTGASLGRRARAMDHLLLAATILLAWDPGSVRGVGFLLSFTAFAGIMTLGRDPRPPAERRLIRKLRTGWRFRAGERISAGLRISTAAFLGSLPASLLVFHRVTPMAIPASVLLAPFIPLLLGLGALLVAFPGATPLGALADGLVTMLRAAVTWLEQVPGGSVTAARPAPAAWVVFGAGTLAYAALRGRRPRSALLAAVVGVITLVLWPKRPLGVFQLVAGRGAALLVVGSEEAWLIDCGPRSARVTDQVLGLGVRRLTGVLISHDHADHAGGLGDVLARLDPAILRGVGDHRIVAGWRRASANLELRALWPAEDQLPDLDKNDASTVILIQIDHRVVLVTGDVETKGLTAWLARGPLPRCDVVVVPHHGGHNHALQDLLLATQPETLWIPARRGGPSPETLLLLRAWGVPIHTTGRDGILSLRP